MKTVCIYHSIDLDGWMSAAIVKHWWELNTKMQEGGVRTDIIDFIGYNYGQPIPNLSEYDRVIMVDISFKDKNNSAKPMIDLYESLTAKNYISGGFIYIDHHISAINDIKMVSRNGDIPFLGIRDTNYAACELTWKYFFPNEPMPEIVRLLGRYDCFGHKGTDEERKVLEVQYGAREAITNYEEAYNHLIDEANEYAVGETVVDVFWNNGAVIYKYLCTDAKHTYTTKFDLLFRNDIIKGSVRQNGIVKFAAINRERFNPINFGIDYHAEGYDGAACFHYDGGRKVWAFSLYNDNGFVDCSVIAKQFGGGGHKGAAGFIVNDLNKVFK